MTPNNPAEREAFTADEVLAVAKKLRRHATIATVRNAEMLEAFAARLARAEARALKASEAENFRDDWFDSNTGRDCQRTRVAPALARNAEPVYQIRRDFGWEDLSQQDYEWHKSHVECELRILYAGQPPSPQGSVGDEYLEIARLVGSIYFAGNFHAETPNELELEKLLKHTGNWFTSWEEIPEPFATHQPSPETERDADLVRAWRNRFISERTRVYTDIHGEAFEIAIANAESDARDFDREFKRAVENVARLSNTAKVEST